MSIAPYVVSTPRAVSVNSTAIRVSWSPPGRLNGVLLSYDVVIESVVGTSTAIRLNSGLATEVFVSNLKPFTTYNITVNVTTNGGTAVSAPATVTTNEAGAVLAWVFPFIRVLHFLLSFSTTWV